MSGGRFSDHWPEILLALFAVSAGQIGRLGQKLERGDRIGMRHVIIELSMFPAFGSLVGAFGVEMGWPIWLILAAGIAAGWLGFFTFRLIANLVLGLARHVINAASGRPGNGLSIPELPSEDAPDSPDQN